MIFTAGATAGAVTAYFIISAKYEKQYQQFTLDLLSMQTTEENNTSQDAPVVAEQPDMIDILSTYGKDTVEQTTDPFPFEDYEKESQKDPVLDTDEDNEEDDYEDHPIDEPREEPYLITEDEYASTKLYHGKGELYFFARDEVITDDEEEPLYDYEKYIGKSAVPELLETQDSVYVRNERLGEDYLIVYCDKFWMHGNR